MHVSLRQSHHDESPRAALCVPFAGNPTLLFDRCEGPLFAEYSVSPITNSRSAVGASMWAMGIRRPPLRVCVTVVGIQRPEG